jgi:hypothetical protein
MLRISSFDNVPTTTSISITSFSGVETSTSSNKLGAFHQLSSPFAVKF